MVKAILYSEQIVMIAYSERMFKQIEVKFDFLIYPDFEKYNNFQY